MSYYSSVGIVLSNEDYEKMIKKDNFNKYIKESRFTSYYTDKKSPYDFYDDMMYMLTRGAKIKNIEYEGVPCKYISLVCVQWHYEYPQVSYIMNYLKQLDLYQYLRIGEELCDFEERSKGCDYLGFKREILPYSDDF